MKISDILLNFLFGYLPSIMGLLLVFYFFRSFFYSINPYAYWIFAFYLAISNSIIIYRIRNKRPQKLNAEKINSKDWLSLFLYAAICVTGIYATEVANKIHTEYVKSILFGIGLIVTCVGVQLFVEKVKTLKLISKRN